VRGLDEVDGIHLVTNSRFAPAFAAWAEPHGVVVHDDGTSSNDDRRGAVGDLRLVIERAEAWWGDNERGGTRNGGGVVL